MRVSRKITTRGIFLATTYCAVLVGLSTEDARIGSPLFGFGTLFAVLFLFCLLFVYYPLVSGQPKRSRLLLLVIIALVTIGLFLILPSVR